ncbi:hypothetical protein [uncultured Dialister sp.]|uniref:hypothetical protein n=1 Tax=uncultured Dialister sp. TaxID=278064 RepID=UPI00262D3C27|nr:hypothetical protein [uncultured Dialister sp.]
MIKPSKPPQGARENRTTGLRPLEMHPYPPPGETLPEATEGVHFHQAQLGWHVFPRAKGAVVWFYQKRRPYMIVKAAHLFEMQSKTDAFQRSFIFQKPMIK